MDHVRLSKVLSVTSEDHFHTANNLLRGQIGRRWLSTSEEMNGTIEAEFQLVKPSPINSVSFCNFGSVFIEMLVRNGETEDYVSLLQPKMLMTPQESKRGVAKTGKHIIAQAKLSRNACCKEWSRILVRCKQPYTRAYQFGISSLVLSTDPSGPSENSVASPPNKPLPSDADKTPPKVLFGDLQEYEDEQLSPPSPKRRIPNFAARKSDNTSKEKDLLKEDKKNLGLEPNGFQVVPHRQKLLKKELPKPSGFSDFMSSYTASDGSLGKTELDFGKLRRATSIVEQEGFERFSWRRKKNKIQKTIPSSKGWMTTRKEETVTHSEVNSIDESENLPLNKELGVTHPVMKFTECPLCNGLFPDGVIEYHCSSCQDETENVSQTHSNAMPPFVSNSDIVLLD